MSTRRAYIQQPDSPNRRCALYQYALLPAEARAEIEKSLSPETRTALHELGDEVAALIRERNEHVGFGALGALELVGALYARRILPAGLPAENNHANYY